MDDISRFRTSWSSYRGAIISVLVGMCGFLFPAQLGRVPGFALPSRLGVSEFRVTYGGFFIGVGLAVMLVGSHEAAPTTAETIYTALRGRSTSAQHVL